MIEYHFEVVNPPRQHGLDPAEHDFQFPALANGQNPRFAVSFDFNAIGSDQKSFRKRRLDHFPENPFVQVFQVARQNERLFEHLSKKGLSLCTA